MYKKAWRCIVSRIKYLDPDMFEGSAKEAIQFDTQRLIDSTLCVDLVCPSCKSRVTKRVAAIRWRAKNFNFTGYCADCFRHPSDKFAKYLKAEDIKPHLRDYVNLDRQKLFDNRTNDRRTLKVEVTCKRCGKKRWVNASTIRAKSDFTSYCVVCSNTLENHGSWKGGRHVNSGGYMQIRIPKDHPDYEFLEPMLFGKDTDRYYILEHRMVMAKHLGRPLERWEHVHHRNGDKTDNRIENLTIVTAKTHRAIEDAKKVIRQLREENEMLRRELAKLRGHPGGAYG